MNMDEKIQDTAAQFISQLLEKQFGEKPDFISVLSVFPYTVIHLKGFLEPTEKVVLNRNKAHQVLETRDLLIQTLKIELLAGLKEILGTEVHRLYADWNLEQETGMLIAVSDSTAPLPDFEWPPDVNQEAIREIIVMNSQYTQKKPDRTQFHWLNDQVLLIERTGILIEIEKELVRNNVKEELRLAKRPLEHRIIRLFNLDSLLNRRVTELFVDWDFEQDLSYMVLLMEN